jgi:transcriptional regulator with XRE-family HTH domain
MTADTARMREARPEPALGAELRRVREERGYSQEGLAFRSKTTTGTVARLENGQSDPAWSTVRAIMAALDLPLGDLARALGEG